MDQEVMDFINKYEIDQDARTLILRLLPMAKSFRVSNCSLFLFFETGMPPFKFEEVIEYNLNSGWKDPVRYMFLIQKAVESYYINRINEYASQMQKALMINPPIIFVEKK